jgi:hypothetical protein
MPRANCTFRKTDVTRAVLAAINAGLEIDRVEFRPDGMITLHAQLQRDPSSKPARRHGCTAVEAAAPGL